MRRLLITASAGALAVGLLAGCSSGGGSAASNVKVDKDKQHVTATDGDNSISVGNAKLPASFPNDDVPLPGGTLKAAIASSRGRSQAYTLSFAIPGGDVAGAATSYKSKLTHAGYHIQASASRGAAAAVFSAYTAIGKDWDVVVYSGGNAGADALLALQVTKHDPAKDPTGSGDPNGATTG